MTAPIESKSAKFSPEVHAEILRVAREIGGTMDDALRHVLGMSTIRVPVTDVQRERWTEAADVVGVTVEQFVLLRVESALYYNTTADAIYSIYTGVTELCRAEGLEPPLIEHHGRAGVLGATVIPREFREPNSQ